MKLIYNEKCFINIDSSFPRKSLTLYLDGIKKVLDFSEGQSQINIPVYNVREVMFEKQFGRFVKFSNVRTIKEEMAQHFEENGIIRKNDIYYREISKGTCEKVLFVFMENLTYIEQATPYFEKLDEEGLKIVQVFDEYLQNGSDFLIGNDGKPLVDQMSQFISTYTEEYGTSNISFLGIKSGAIAASLYGNIFGSNNIVTFNSQDDCLKDNEKREILNTNNFQMDKAIEVSSFPKDEFELIQREAKYIIANEQNRSIKSQTYLAIALAKALIGYKDKNYGRIMHFTRDFGNVVQTDNRLIMAFVVNQKEAVALECIRTIGKQGVICDRDLLKGNTIITINENSINYYERVDFDD